MTNRAILSKSTFKTDCIDFISMTHDLKIGCDILDDDPALYNLYTNHKKIAIYTSHENAVVLKDDFVNKSKLITVTKKVNSNHHPSVIGSYILDSIGCTKRKTPQKFIDENNGKYVAKLARIFHLSTNHIKIWNEFCTNGLFNIWNPAAPYNRLNEPNHQVDPFNYNPNTKEYDLNEEKYMHKNQLSSARILLLRIFKLNEEVSYKNDEINVQHRQFDIVEPKKVLLDKPVINNFDFNCIYSEILDALNRLQKLIPNFRFNEDSYGQNYKLKYLPSEERNCNNEKINV